MPNIDAKQKEMVDEIKSELKARSISQTEFCRVFFREFFGEHVDDDRLEKHYERFKKVLALKRNTPENIALYYAYFKNKYMQEKVISPESREAAWKLYIELDTRISSQRLIYGRDSDALKSLHAIFQEWRVTLKSDGYRSAAFYAHSKRYMNDTLRIFTSKWHEKEKINSTQFREELVILQNETRNYIIYLKKDFHLIS